MRKFINEWIPYIILIIIIILVRSYLVTPVIVKGTSMEDKLHDGEVLILNKITYRFNDIKRYDTVVIKDDSNLIIKRIIGLPGDNIEYKNNKLYINKKQVKDKYSYTKTDNFTLEEICKIRNTNCNGKIPKGMYLALGDNRRVSADSRIKGLFTKKEILGKTNIRIFPLTKISNINKK